MTRPMEGPFTGEGSISSGDAGRIFKSLVDHMSDALLLVDLGTASVLGVNRRASGLLGYSEPTVLLAQRIERIIPSGSALLAALRRQEPWTCRHEEAQLVDHEGRKLEVSLIALVVELAGGVGCVLLARPRATARQRPGTDGDGDELTETNLEFPSIVGQSEQIREVCRLIGLVAKTDATVLVQGESGTGKELVAQAIHFHSLRSRGPLVMVNCAALSDTLLESELFGHRKGAFTGAVQNREGRFKVANGGTIVLDEIDSMSLAGQAKLLRVLQESEFEPVGSSTPVRVDLRVIAITNASLTDAISAGSFREDLFYRLSAFPIDIASLRDRRVDVPLLTRHFLRRYSSSLHKRISDVSPEALSRLMSYPWPGNVRELANTIEYAVILEKDKRLSAGSLPDKLRRAKTVQESLRERVQSAEKKFILEALYTTNGVKNRAAKLLGIDRRNLTYFLNKHSIDWRPV